MMLHLLFIYQSITNTYLCAQCTYLAIGSDPTQYQAIRKIGKGKYSNVYHGIILTNASSTNASHSNSNTSFDGFTKCVIKRLKPINLDRVKREVLILKDLQNGTISNNIIRFIDVVRVPAANADAASTSLKSSSSPRAENTSQAETEVVAAGVDSVSLIFEYINNTHFQELYPLLTDQDVRLYMFKLLQALEYSHSKG